MSEPVWMQIARREIGVHEYAGPKSNSRINEYLASAHAHPNDDTPWCSAFISWCIEQAGAFGTERLAARSWLRWGVSHSAEPGAIVVLWRNDPQGPNGHVGFFVRANSNKTITLLSGNSNNQVCERAYSTERILAFRWPSPADLELIKARHWSPTP